MYVKKRLNYPTLVSFANFKQFPMWYTDKCILPIMALIDLKQKTPLIRIFFVIQNLFNMSLGILNFERLTKPTRAKLYPLQRLKLELLFDSSLITSKLAMVGKRKQCFYQKFSFVSKIGRCGYKGNKL